MLPSMFANTKRNLIAGVTAFAVLAAGTSPALAWGKGEQQFLAGVVSTILVQQILKDIQRNQQPQPTYNPPVRYEPRPINIYRSPTAKAFNSYTDNEQRRIQSTLSAYGYYHTTIDGSFGPGTYNAIALYASRTGKTAMLNNRAGAYGLLDGLLF